MSPRLEPVDPRAETDAHGDQVHQEFPPLCGPNEVARATGYSVSTIMRLQKRGALKHLEHPRPIGHRRYSGVKLAAVARGEDPTTRSFFGARKS